MRTSTRVSSCGQGELIGVVGQLLQPQDVENALVTALCRAGENVGPACADEGIEIVLIAVGLRPDVTCASLGFKRNLYLCFMGMVRELCSKLDDTFNKIWEEMNATVRVPGPNNDDREAGDDYWCFDGGIEVDTYEEVPFARVRQNRSLWYELVVEALGGLRDLLTVNEELQVAGEYIIRFIDLWDQRGQLRRDWWEKAGSRKKLILNKIEKCLDEESPRQWTGEYYLTDLATPIRWLKGIDWGHSCEVCCAWWMGSVNLHARPFPISVLGTVFFVLGIPRTLILYTGTLVLPGSPGQHQKHQCATRMRPHQEHI